MPRVKVISEPADLVPLLRSFDSEVKRQVFQDLVSDWQSRSTIEESYGEEGLETLGLLEKAHLVETRWAPGPEGPEKAYRSFYTSFNINTSSPVSELADMLHVAVMPNDRYRAMEDELLALSEDGGLSLRLAQEKLGVNQPMLKGLVKRSAKLELKGHQIARRET